MIVFVVFSAERINWENAKNPPQRSVQVHDDGIMMCYEIFTI